MKKVDIMTLIEKINELKGSIEATKAEIEKYLTQSSDPVVKPTYDINLLNKYLKELNIIRTAYEKNITNKEELQKRLTELNQGVANRNTKIQGLEKARTEKNVEIEGLKRAGTEKNTKIQGLEKAGTEKNAEIEGLKTAGTTKNAEIEKMKKEKKINNILNQILKKIKNNKIKKISSSLNQKTTELNTLLGTIDERNKNLNNLTQTLINKNKEIEEAEAKATAAEEAAIKLRSNIELEKEKIEKQHKDALTVRNTRIRQLEAEQEQKLKEIATTTERLETERTAVEEAQKALQSAKEESNRRNAELKATTAKLENNREEVKRLRTEADAGSKQAQEQLATAEKRLQEVTKKEQKAEANARNALRQQENAERRVQNAVAAEKKLTETQTRVQTLKTNTEKAIRSSYNAYLRLQELQKISNQRNAELKQATAKLESNRAEVVRLQKEVKAGSEQAEEQLETARKQLEEAAQIKKDAERKAQEANEKEKMAKQLANTAKAEKNAEIAKIQVELNNARRNFQKSSTEFAKIKEQQQETITKLEKTSRELRIRAQEASQNSSALAKIRISEISKEKEALQQQLAALTAEAGTVMAERRQDKNKITLLETEISRLKSQLVSEQQKEAELKQQAIEKCKENIQFFIDYFKRKHEIMKQLDEIIASYPQKNKPTYINNTINEYNNLKPKITNFEKQILATRLLKKAQQTTNGLGVATQINKLETVSNNEITPEKCSQLGNLLTSVQTKALDFEEPLTNIYEDLSGAVRVYVRARGTTETESDVVGKNEDIFSLEEPQSQQQGGSNEKGKTKIILTCITPNKTYTNFYGVFPPSFKNKNVYTGIPSSNSNINQVKINKMPSLESQFGSPHPGLFSLFQQVQDGYSIVIFGYGLSGSGKTYTLLGNETTHGILQYGLKNLKNVKSKKLKAAFELYIKDGSKGFNVLGDNISMVAGNLIPLYFERKKPEGEISKPDISLIKTQLEAYINKKIFFNNTTETLVKFDENYPIINGNENIQEIISKITTHRKQKGRIKETINNPESSRSHLFLVFEVNFDNGTTGYITIVDMAGRESPFEIFKASIKNYKNNKPITEQIMTYVASFTQAKTTQSPTPEYSTLRESFYINETINHLKYFFLKKNGKKIKMEGLYTPPNGDTENPNLTMTISHSLLKYQTTNLMCNPINEVNHDYAANNGFNSLMIPVLQWLGKLGGENKPAKYVMMCCIRPGSNYCDQTKETLEFANSIKST